MAIIRVEKMSKSIKGKEILKDISFEIKPGECVALIGPNGAGKTSLLNCLLGEKKVDIGQITLDGMGPQEPSLKEKIGILPQENTVVQGLTVAELISFFREIYANPLSMSKIDELLGFDQKQKKQLAHKLSGGQKRLLSFVLSLIGQPRILFLDEPTAGMDTSTRQHFWQVIQQLKDTGVTILYSSHYIEEVEHTADRILVLHRGQLIRDTSPYAMRMEEMEKYFTLPEGYLPFLEQSDLVENLQIHEENLTFTTKQADQVWDLLQGVGCLISQIEVSNRSLLTSLFESTKEDENETNH